MRRKAVSQYCGPVQLASRTLLLLALTGFHVSVSPLPPGASRSAAAASLLTEEQMGRFQVRIRGAGPTDVPTKAPDRAIDEAPSPVGRVERVAPAVVAPPAKPTEAVAARVPAEEPRRKTAGRGAGTASEAVPLAAGVQALRTALAATKGRIEELERISGQR
jgi:hypothetical protein